MFDDLKFLIERSDLPDSAKIALAILTKAISWLPWAFVGVGFLIKLEFFTYWLAFFVFIEGSLFVALMYLLVLLVRASITSPSPGPPPPHDTTSRKHPSPKIIDTAKQGVIGNFAFYAFILAVFIVMKGMGLVDAAIAAIARLVP